MTPPSPILGLISDLEEVESELERLKAERDQIREQVSIIVAEHDNKIVIDGYGTLQIRAPSVSQRWDSDALKELVQSLRETGQTEIADEIAACQKRITTTGGLAIIKEKKKP